MLLRSATPYYSVVLDAALGIVQKLNPAIKSTLSNNGHTLTLYNISESDIGQITIVSPDGKSNQNIHFERLSVYFANQSIVDPIRVYGLNDIVGQTYRQEEGSAYTKLSRETTFQPWVNLDIPRLTDDLSEIGNKVGVSQNTRGQPKLYSVRLGNGKLKVVVQPNSAPPLPEPPGYNATNQEIINGLNTAFSGISGLGAANDPT